MVSLNKSFFYGICFASLTWSISLYLLWQLNSKSTSDTFSLDGTSPEWLGNEVLSGNEKTRNDKYSINQLWYKRYVNTKRVIDSLEPIKDVQLDINELGMVKTDADRVLRDEGYKIHAFNVLVSNQLSLHRAIPDTRNKLCSNIPYPATLPNASIVICFYNEHLTTLLRSVYSIIDHTPTHMLHEIILVDDYSDIPGLYDDIKKHLESHTFLAKVKLLRTERREGLIRARLFGARNSMGEVLVFLDSHIEVNVDWAQPMLKRIQENKTNVVMPIIDVINADTFAYSSSPLVRGGFNWGLHFKWDNLPKGTLVKDEDFIKPIKSPTMAGGLFAIDRKYFVDLGEYDAGMNIWGGENLEISFRIWMCGGNLEMIPCSRVGHVFRKRRPYGSPDGQDTMLYNSLRVAHVWLDDYKDYYLQQRKDSAKEPYGDISSRIQLRKELKCRDFDWYVKNVYPELTLPSDNEERLKKKWAALEQDKFQPWHSRKRNYVGQYQIRMSDSSLCVQSSKDFKTKGSLLELRPCLRSKSQIWYETDKSELVLAQLLCLQAGHPDPHLYKCHEMGGDQEWKHKSEKYSPIYNMAAGTCLGVRKVAVGSPVIMTLCTDPTFNKWDIVHQ